ncbi:UNVERIFIED_CONTAM: hypothetical protein PYX00_008430 [Menopon gallinae]|uniref:Uncharacterized protein n=1 Tax=Menopon gallinae TaxID=328185 RepID=A0AAW2HNA3_9NEOP
MNGNDKQICMSLSPDNSVNNIIKGDLFRISPYHSLQVAEIAPNRFKEDSSTVKRSGPIHVRYNPPIHLEDELKADERISI